MIWYLIGGAAALAAGYKLYSDKKAAEAGHAALAAEAAKLTYRGDAATLAAIKPFTPKQLLSAPLTLKVGDLIGIKFRKEGDPQLVNATEEQLAAVMDFLDGHLIEVPINAPGYDRVASVSKVGRFIGPLGPVTIDVTFKAS